MDDFCEEHQGCNQRVMQLEKEVGQQWTKLDSIQTKLNLILGGIIISPFFVTIVTLLIKFKT